MITKLQRKRIKKELGTHYTSKILAYFKKNDITRPNGEEYTAGYIRVVMNGQENESIETGIYNCVQFEKLRKATETKRRNNILNKKTDAVTSD